ncbi:MAG: Hsp20/alpha crystallin family protein [Chitinophagaceae bacterium]
MTYLNLNTRPIAGSFNRVLENILVPANATSQYDTNALHNGRGASVNINKVAEGYEIEVMAPGFSKEDFKIDLDKNLLTLSAETKPNEATDKKSIRSEFSIKGFKRSFTIDEHIEVEKITARHSNGILVLHLPKKEEVKAPVKQILID